MSPSGTSTQLAEHLQVAKGLPPITKRQWLPGAITEQDIPLPEDLKLLEDLAVAVAIGGDNRDVAITMEKATDGVHHFTLAIKGRLSRDDEDAARRLFEVLRMPREDFPNQIRSVVRSYANPGMETAIRVVAEPLDEFVIKLDYWLENDSIRCGNIKNELPSSDEVLARFPKPEGVPVKEYIASLWNTLRASILDENGSARQLSQINTDNVFFLAAQLSGSRVFRRLFKGNMEKQFVGSVRYKLATLGRYWTCVSGLAHGFRLIDGRFDYSWVREMQPLENALKMTRCPRDIIQSNQQIRMACRRQLPYLIELATKQYKEDVALSIHPEIQLILNAESDTAPYIGSSTGTCFCCKLWIDDYNKRMGAKWEMSRSLEQPDETWGVPGQSSDDVVKIIDHEVTEMMFTAVAHGAGVLEYN
ncbi:hypothetical protein OE88DRAFT_1669275 [Heliocybe sulcata]|uniref:Uncharacterized protein n=1 Tax=Heliocybe sulcata TaxID=5364 RepID=A0A5C3MM69_9AGAM|nr:hypothetical protein OE88DRAFT_1669275 [Heliocybe sulcata]